MPAELIGLKKCPASIQARFCEPTSLGDTMHPETVSTSPSPDRLRTQAASLRSLAAELEDVARQIEAAAQSARDQALDLEALRGEFGFSRESLATAARDGLPVHRGSRGRLLAFRSDVEAWIRSRAWSPSKRRRAESEDDALARAEAELLAGNRSGNRRGQGTRAA